MIALPNGHRRINVRIRIIRIVAGVVIYGNGFWFGEFVTLAKIFHSVCGWCLACACFRLESVCVEINFPVCFSRETNNNNMNNKCGWLAAGDC